MLLLHVYEFFGVMYAVHVIQMDMIYGKKYHAISLLWMIHYISLFTNRFTQWIHIGAYCGF